MGVTSPAGNDRGRGPCQSHNAHVSYLTSDKLCPRIPHFCPLVSLDDVKHEALASCKLINPNPTRLKIDANLNEPIPPKQHQRKSTTHTNTKYQHNLTRSRLPRGTRRDGLRLIKRVSPIPPFTLHIPHPISHIVQLMLSTSAHMASTSAPITNSRGKLMSIPGQYPSALHPLLSHTNNTHPIHQ